MKKSILLWLIAFVLTVFTAIYQRMTGPTYPISGETNINGDLVEYKLDRTHGGEGDHLIEINADNENICAELLWKRGANLIGADFNGADLYEADFTGADLTRANLKGASLRNANLVYADLSGTNLSMSELVHADFTGAKLIRTDLDETIFNNAVMGYTSLVDVDLSNVIGLDTIKHRGPSYVGIETIYRSKGKISELFLRGAGLTDAFIEYLPYLIEQAIQFYSCFISYSTKDEDFAKRLHADLQANAVRCWFAPEDIKAGRKLHEQIPDAIRLYDKPLLVISEDSMQSEWVRTEIYHARQDEIRNKKRKLFPKQ